VTGNSGVNSVSPSTYFVLILLVIFELQKKSPVFLGKLTKTLWTMEKLGTTKAVEGAVITAHYLDERGTYFIFSFYLFL
jgi:hypothetical protein